MATYQRRKSKRNGDRVTVTVRVHPYLPQSRTFSRLTDARAWAKDIESDMRNGRFRAIRPASARTLAELIDRYISETFANRKSKQFPFTVLQWWKAKLGHYRLQDLTKATIKQTWRTLESEPSARSGKVLTNRTLNGYLENLSSCLSYATNELDWLEHNACLGLRKKSVMGNWRLRLLSDDELRRFLQAVRESSNDYLLPAVLIALATGARRGELMGLSWDDVSLTTGEVTFTQTKNGYSRTVVLSQSALDALKKHAKVRRLDSSLLFPSRKHLWKSGQGWTSKLWEELQSPFERARISAGITDFKWHDLRHQAASLLIASGASLEEVGKVLGHRTPQMTWRYAKLLQDRNRTLVAAVDEQYIRQKLIG